MPQQNFLQQIIADSAAVNLDEVKPPEVQVGPGQTVIGELDEEHRRLYALMLQYEQEFKNELVKAQEAVEAMVIGVDAQKEVTDRLEFRLKLLSARLDAVRKLFWASLEEQLAEKLVGSKSVGLAEGWQVYREEKDDFYDGCPACRGGHGFGVIRIMSVPIEERKRSLLGILCRAFSRT